MFNKINILLIVCLLLPVSANAELVLTAPPRESEQAGVKLYGPLAEHLSKTLGQKVTYRHPKDWKDYEAQMKKGGYDIIFDGPHFAAWRIETNQAEPLVKLPGNLDFSLVVKKTQASVSKTSDLVGKKVCTLPSPNLGAMTLYAMFPNPVRQPEFIMVKGGMKQIVEKLQQGACVAAIMRRGFYAKKLKVAMRNSLRVLETSQALTNQGITVNKKVPATVKQLMLTSLTDAQGRLAARPLFERFSSKAQAFVPATMQDYEHQNLLRENMIFGW
jgi:ABC-type phosphate/phosphonate transport system substrate-binding protein